jgi:hypothetical protein
MRIRFALALVVLVALPASIGAQVRWTLDPKPLLDIKGVDDAGTMIFGSATWATRLRDGTVVLADPGGPALHFIDAQGRLRKSAGRSGSGPGDFRTVTWVAQCGADGIFAWDFPQQRVSVYDEAGSFKSSFRFGPGGGGAQFLSACNINGSLFAFTANRRLPPTSTPDPAEATMRIVMAGTPALVSLKGDTVAKFPEVVVGEMVAANGGGGPRPLGLAVHYALGADRLWLGQTDSSSIAVYSLDGKRIGTIPVPVPARPVTKPNYERATDAFVAIVPAPSRARFRAMMLETPPPARMPPFTGIFADPTGLVWAVLSAPGDPDTQLRAFGRDGSVAANVSFPVNLNIFEIGTDYVLGSRLDADGEERIVVYRLNRTRP